MFIKCCYDIESTFNISQIVITHEHTGLLQIPTFQPLILSNAMA